LRTMTSVGTTRTFRDVPAPVANQVESGPRELANVVLLFRRGIVGELANALKIPL